jgi:hypothetical protein
MFYAIVDRGRYEITLNNGCILLLDSRGDPVGAPRYYFSTSRDALQEQPWRDGYVYFLPSDSFNEQPAGVYAGHTARIPQLASPVPVALSRGFESPRATFPFSRRFAATKTNGWANTPRL